MKVSFAQQWLGRNRKFISLFAALLIVALALLIIGASVPATVQAQATATPTNTPTTAPTNTPTPTPIATGLPNPQGSGFVQYLRCGSYSFGQVTPGTCLTIYNGSDIEAFSAAGARTYYMDGESGNVTITGRLAQGPAGIKCVRGQQSVLGSATVIAATPAAAGISTPQFVQHSLAADPVGNYNLVTHTNSAGVVTLKVWGLVAQTPVAATTAVAVDYELCGS